MFYQGKHFITKHSPKWILLISILLILTVGVSVTVCYMVVDSEEPVAFNMTHGEAKCEITEEAFTYYYGDDRTSPRRDSYKVTIKNTGTVTAYVRVYFDGMSADTSSYYEAVPENKTIYYKDSYFEANNYNDIFKDNLRFVDIENAPVATHNNVPVYNEFTYEQYNTQSNINWRVGKDMFLYYLKPLAPGAEAELVYHVRYTTKFVLPERSQYRLDIYAQAVQAEATVAAGSNSPREDAWGKDLKDIADNAIPFQSVS